MLKKVLQKLYTNAVFQNHKNITSLFETKPNAKLLDLGCDDGVLTKGMGNAIGTEDLCGIEIVPERIAKASKNGVKVYSADLNKQLPLDSSSFDAIHANQVIEHLHDADCFLGEIYRILKPNGYAIISTENASSWCNIFASVMGWQIFSLTNFSGKKTSIGNPFALHKDEKSGLSSWRHTRIYNLRGLKEYFEVFGFKVEEIKGAGYFPFPGFLGNIDKTHCHFMTFKIRKPKQKNGKNKKRVTDKSPVTVSA